MLEAGELPFMRGLHALKKKQGLKDPLIMRPSSKSPPLLQASPSSSSNSNSSANSPFRRGLQGNEWENQWKDFHTAPEVRSRTKADMRLSWDMSKEALFKLDLMHAEDHQSIMDHFDKWRVPGEHVACEGAYSITSNSSEKALGEEDQFYASLRHQRHNVGLTKPSQKILKRDHSLRHAAHMRPGVSASRQCQAPRELELMESKMHFLELPRSAMVRSQVITSAQSKPCVPKGFDGSRRKSAHHSPRRTQKVMKSSVLEKGPSAHPCHWSEWQDDYGSDVSTTSSAVVGHGYKGFSQNESCEDSKLKHCKQEEASCLQLAVTNRKDLVVEEDKPRSLSQKYRPTVFREIVGQHIVVQSLSNAILKGKVVPVYLFQGPRGTGKTSAARIFAAALLCIAPPAERPCGHCNECMLARSGKNGNVKEVDAASNNGIAKVKVLLEEIILASTLSHYKVFIIDECHVLTAETWNALLRILEEPPMNVVFILITTDPDQLPRTAMSRCQKFPFLKLKDAEIIERLIDLTGRECVELDLEILKLIASKSDGSLRDAEMTLDQLSLLGQEINFSTVYALVGSASDGRILSLLDSALLADTVNTSKKARELVDSGVQPLALMSHMATTIIDILAGSYQFTEEQRKGFFHRQIFSVEKLEQLRKAVNTLLEAEKQLRVSKDKMAWLIAALLQLGPDRLCMFPASGSGTSITQSPNTLVDVDHGVLDIQRDCVAQRHYQGNVESSSVSINSQTSIERTPLADEQVSSDRPMIQSDVRVKYNLASSNLSSDKTTKESSLTPEDIDSIWSRVVEICRPFRLRQSLHGHGKLISISLLEGSAVVHLEFIHPKHKAQCERCWENISTSFEEILGCPVEVNYSLVSEHGIQPCDVPEQKVLEDFIIKGTTCSPRSAVSMNNLLPNGSQSYSAMSQAPSACTFKDIQCERTKSLETSLNTSEPMSHGASGSSGRIHNATKEVSMEEVLLSSEEQLDRAWICDEEDRPSSSVDPVNMSHREVTNQSGHHHVNRALPDLLPTKTLFMQELQNASLHGRAWEDIVKPDVLFSGSHTFGLWDNPEKENQTMSGVLEGCNVPGRTSLKKKGNVLKVMQRLAFRSWNRSVADNFQNSTEDRESTAAFTISESQRNSHSSNDTRFSADDVSEHSTKAGSKMLLAPLLKNKLRGTVGNVARFFQEKLSRNSHDVFVQCI